MQVATLRAGITRALLLTVAASVFVACGGSSEGKTVALTGAGATFPYPIYSKWFDAFFKATGNQVNYQSLGSGAGVKQYTEGTVEFGATDGPMSDEEIAAAKGQVIHVPTVLGADVVTWNLPAYRQDAARVRRRHPRRHLSRQDHEVERSATHGAQSGREAARHRPARGASVGWFRYDVHLDRLSEHHLHRNGSRRSGVESP